MTQTSSIFIHAPLIGMAYRVAVVATKFSKLPALGIDEYMVNTKL